MFFTTTKMPYFPRIGTYHRQSNPHSNLKGIFDFQNHLSGRANQNRQHSNQTGSWVISLQIFEISTPNLLLLVRLYNLCKGNFKSKNIIDIKQIEFIADAKIMLYTSAGQKVILWFNHKFIWRLENAQRIHKSEKKLNVKWINCKYLKYACLANC